MFDIGFSELIVIAIVALIVIGPERLPAVARTVGTLLGRLRRYTDDVKAEVHRELQLDDIRKMQRDLAEQASALETKVSREMTELADPLSGARPAATNEAPAQLVEPLPEAVPQPALPIEENRIHSPR